MPVYRGPRKELDEIIAKLDRKVKESIKRYTIVGDELEVEFPEPVKELEKHLVKK